MFAGDLDRARRQIDALEYTDNDLEPRGDELPQADRLRAGAPRSLRAGRRPGVLRRALGAPAAPARGGQPAPRGRADAEAAELLARAAEATPPSGASSTAQPFESFRDADDLFGGVLEVMAQGRYFWAGLEQVRLVAMNPPRFPRDLLYIPARLELEGEAGRRLPAGALSRVARASPTTRSGWAA